MTEGPDLPFSRWWFVVVAALAMGLAGTYQFVWSSIRVPLGTHLDAPEAALGTVFTLFVVFQTVSQFPAGWVRDRYGPRWPLAAGAVCLLSGYAGTAAATDIRVVYLAYAVGGVGVGVAYTVAVNTPVKWFTERRGLATGLAAMSYSGASFLLIPVVRRGLAADFAATLLALGALAGVASLLAAVVLRDPMAYDGNPDDSDATPGSEATDAAEDANGGDGADAGGGANADDADGDCATTDGGAGGDGTTAGDDANADDMKADGGGEGAAAYTWRDAIRTWQFWLLYAVFVVVNGVGLMVVGKVVAFADAMGLSGAAATGSASLVALADAGGVLVGGSASDWFGRERTVAVGLLLSGGSLAAATVAATAGLGLAFVALVGGAAFFRSPVFSVFPAITGAYYGEARSSENYAVLYTAKLWGGVAGGTAASALVVAVGWSPAFLLGSGLIAAAGLATFLLRPV